MLVSLKSAAKRLLQVELTSLGFTKCRRDGVYAKPLGDEALLYFHCRPRISSGRVMLRPMIGIENFALRRLIGEDEPKQPEPRFVHLFLSYMVGSGMTLWSFTDEAGLKAVIGSIIDTLRQAGIPFAERWSPLDAAIDLLRKDFAGDAPWGAVTHPTLATKAIIAKLPGHTKPIH